jgi:hypothetical protein
MRKVMDQFLDGEALLNTVIMGSGVVIGTILFSHFFDEKTLARAIEILLLIVTTSVTGYCFVVLFKARHREWSADVSMKEADVQIRKAQANCLFVQHQRGTTVWHSGAGYVYHFNSGGKYPESDTDAPVEAEYRESTAPLLEYRQKQGKDQPLTALDATIDAERGLIIGGTRSGKTFFCKCLAAAKLALGQRVIIIDPKFQDPNEPWPQGAALYGSGDNYAEIGRVFHDIEYEKERRGRDIANIKSYPFFNIFIDEVNDLIDNVPGLDLLYITILRKYAQYQIGIFVVGQSNRARAIGLSGKYDLMQCFDFVCNLRYNRQTEERAALIDYQDGTGQIECAPPTLRDLPGAQVYGERYPQDQSRSQILSGQDYTRGFHAAQAFANPPRQKEYPKDVIYCHRHVVPPEPDDHRQFNPMPGLNDATGFQEAGHCIQPDKNRKIIEMYSQGNSLSKIAKAVFKYTNGRNIQKVRNILQEHGVA